MKKLLVIALSAFTMNAFAAGTIAPSQTPSKPATENVTGDTTGNCILLKTSFFFVPSANVGVAWDCSTTAAVINAGNTKGKFSYGASTNGGSAKQCSTTSPDISTTNGYAKAPSLVATQPDGCS